MAILSKAGITNNSTIQASHITQSIDALTGQVTDYDITISGSLAVTGSFGVFKSNTNNRVFYITTGSNNIEQHYLVVGVQDWIVGQDGRDNKFKISSADNNFASQNVGLTISSSGEVSIGTTSSLARLHVNPANTNNLITSLFTIGQSDNGFKAGFANGTGSTIGSEQAKVGMWFNPTVNSTANPVTHIGFIRGNSGDGSGITFNVNNTEMMRISSTGAITASGAISSSAGLFGTTLRTSGAITSSGAISSSAGLFSTTLTTTGAITASIISASSGITASAITVGTILTLTPYTSLPASAPSGSLAVSGSGTAMRLVLYNGSSWVSQT